MWEYIEVYNRLKNEFLSKDTPRLTKRKDIFEELGYIANDSDNSIVAKSTVEIKLNVFQKCMLYARHLGDKNPYTIPSSPLPISVSPMLWNVHYRMYIFLIDNEFMKITTTDFINYKFSWNIPEPFMPILCAYISATHFPKTATASAVEFFNRLDAQIKIHFPSFFNRPNTEIQFATAWSMLFLGRNYFYDIETYISELANTTGINESLLYKDLAVLTDIQKYCISTTGLTSIYTHQLLLHFFKLCKEQKGAYTLSKAFTPQGEVDLINYLFSTFQYILQRIISFIETYPKHPKFFRTFPIAVANYSDWEKTFNQYLNELSEFCSDLSSYVTNYYDDMYNSLLKQIQTGNITSLLINGNNLHTHSEFFIQEFTKSCKTAKENCQKFIRKVRLVSDENTNERDNMELTFVRLTDLTTPLHELLKKLDEKIKKDFIALPPYLTHYYGEKHLDFAYPLHIENDHYGYLLLNAIYPANHPMLANRSTTLSMVKLANSLKNHLITDGIYKRPCISTYASCPIISNTHQQIKFIISLKDFIESLDDYEHFYSSKKKQEE